MQAQNTEVNMDSLSYSVGVLLAQNLKNQGFTELDSTSLANAIGDVLNDRTLAISSEEAQAVVNSFASKKAEAKSAKAMEGGVKFLEENAKREGVMITASGLQYEVVQAGSGTVSPRPNDKVRVHYHGMLIDGTVFDSSIERGQPITFGVNQVIQGWQEALQLMKEGDKWRVYIPYHLAYGERGAGAAIPPYSALIFDVELIGIE
jgi:FKBP-type peptidyl-prolyl cis-trans isomerase FklB